MAEIRLQGARVGALVGKLKAAGVPEHALKPSLAATPSRATILRHPAVVKGGCGGHDAYVATRA
jgi:hypothetical protein